MSELVIHNVRFDERGLIPAILQDVETREVIALSYLDNARLAQTLKTGQASFLTDKGEAADRLSCRLLDVRVNSDGASLTVLVERGEAANAESRPPSFTQAEQKPQRQNPAELSLVDVDSMEFGLTVNKLYSLIADRKEKRPEGSYTSYLFNSGLDKILKKIAEESGEVIIAAKNRSSREVISELADLFYHLVVLMVERDVQLSDVRDELTRRAEPKKQ
ncbi:MAG TPA: phosphoribosyl-ATP diphosphatase [Blastocatellia bacterium]|nr:phosphoribosyl-ATP diphosphatase [Blastocatellia bacterium]